MSELKNSKPVKFYGWFSLETCARKLVRESIMTNKTRINTLAINNGQRLPDEPKFSLVTEIILTNKKPSVQAADQSQPLVYLVESAHLQQICNVRERDPHFSIYTDVDVSEPCGVQSRTLLRACAVMYSCFLQATRDWCEMWIKYLTRTPILYNCIYIG